MSGSPIPVIKPRSICAAIIEKTIPLPPYPSTAEQRGYRGIGPMLGVPVVEGVLPEGQVTVGPATRNGRSGGPSVLRGRSPSNGPGYKSEYEANSDWDR